MVRRAAQRRFRRVLVGLTVATASCASGACVSRAAAAPPDGRGYELVSAGDGPVVINGNNGTSHTDAAGDAVSFDIADVQGSDGDPSGSLGTLVVANRSSSGWSTLNPAPPLTAPETAALQNGTFALSLDRSHAVVGSDQPLTPSAPKAQQVLYMRDADGSFSQISATGNAVFDAVSSDFHRVIYAAGAPQVSGGSDPGNEVYEWSSGAVRVFSILPDGSPASSPQFGSNPGSSLSGDGQTGLFSDSGELYLHPRSGPSVDISRAQGNVSPDPGQLAGVAGFDGDETDVFFLDHAELIQGANTGGDDSGTDLYEYNLATRVLSDLTPDSTDASGAQVQQVQAISRDGSYVYFTASGHLAADAPPGPGPNGSSTSLYVEHDGTIRYIDDNLVANPSVTPDGRHLVFGSDNRLTGYDNTDVAAPGPNSNAGNPDPEAFEYDAVTGSVTCVSCRPSGARPTGYALPDAISDDGSRVFFDSYDAVVPQAANGDNNVYEYEDGHPSLISSGTGPGDSNFLLASPSGNDVFFTSYDDAVPATNPSHYEQLLDARVGGGFPSAAAQPAPCGSSATCQSTVPTPPATPVPVTATVSFPAPGNRSPRPTPRVTTSNHRLAGTRIAIRVKIPAAGRLLVSSGSTVRLTRTFKHGATTTITVRLNGRARRALASRHRLRLTLRLRYSPPTGSARTTTLPLTATQESHR